MKGRPLWTAHTICPLGRWLYSDDVAKTLSETAPELYAALSAIKGPHRLLHSSLDEVSTLIAAGDHETAVEHFRENTKKFIRATMTAIEGTGSVRRIITWQDHGKARRGARTAVAPNGDYT